MNGAREQYECLFRDRRSLKATADRGTVVSSPRKRNSPTGNVFVRTKTSQRTQADDRYEYLAARVPDDICTICFLRCASCLWCPTFLAAAAGGSIAAAPGAPYQSQAPEALAGVTHTAASTSLCVQRRDEAPGEQYIDVVGGKMLCRGVGRSFEKQNEQPAALFRGAIVSVVLLARASG